MFEKGKQMANRLVAVDTQKSSKKGEFKGRTIPDVSIVAVNKPDVDFTPGDSPEERKEKILAVAHELAKDWHNCVSVFEVKSAKKFDDNHTRQATDYGYHVSKYTVIDEYCQ